MKWKSCNSVSRRYAHRCNVDSVYSGDNCQCVVGGGLLRTAVNDSLSPNYISRTYALMVNA